MLFGNDQPPQARNTGFSRKVDHSVSLNSGTLMPVHQADVG
jgi:hypothetical protein